MGTLANNYMGLVDALNDLKERGFKSDFRVISCEGEAESEACRLQSDTTGKTYPAGDLTIREYYRFEGPSNPDDMSVAYAIECASGEKGVLIDAYGTYSSRRLAEFIRDLKIDTDTAEK